MRKTLLMLVIVVGMGGLAHAQSCSDGATCVVGTPLPGWQCGCGLTCIPADSEMPDPTIAVCANLQTDPFNCGAAGHACTFGDDCVSGVCHPGGDGTGPGEIQPAKRRPVPGLALIRFKHNDITAALAMLREDPPACAPQGTVDCQNDDNNCGAIAVECDSDRRLACNQGSCVDLCSFLPQDPDCAPLVQEAKRKPASGVMLKPVPRRKL